MCDCKSYRIEDSLKHMAWARAKGELLSILAGYWGRQDEYERLRSIFYEFIEKIENESPLA